MAKKKNKKKKIIQPQQQQEEAIIATKHDSDIAVSDILNTQMDDESKLIESGNNSIESPIIENDIKPNKKKKPKTTKEYYVVQDEPSAFTQLTSEFKKHRIAINKLPIAGIFVSPFNWRICKTFGVFRIWVAFVYVFSIVAIALSVSDWANGQPSSILASIFNWSSSEYKSMSTKNRLKSIMMSVLAFVFVFIMVTLCMSVLLQIVLSIIRIMIRIFRFFIKCCAGCCLDVIGYQPKDKGISKKTHQRNNNKPIVIKKIVHHKDGTKTKEIQYESDTETESDNELRDD